MATASNNVLQPDHTIIWCDKNMCQQGKYDASRTLLHIAADLNHPESIEHDQIIGNFIDHMDPSLNESKFRSLIKSPLRLFVDENECMKCIHDHIQMNRKIFLITSGRTGRVIIPEIFKEREIQEKLSGCVYVFCGVREDQDKWAEPFEKYIEIYDDERGVFGKVLSDIGAYYYGKSQDETTDSAAVLQYLYWAGRLFNTATKIDRIDRNDYLKYIQLVLPHPCEPPADADNSDIQISVPVQESHINS